MSGKKNVTVLWGMCFLGVVGFCAGFGLPHVLTVTRATAQELKGRVPAIVEVARAPTFAVFEDWEGRNILVRDVVHDTMDEYGVVTPHFINGAGLPMAVTDVWDSFISLSLTDPTVNGPVAVVTYRRSLCASYVGGLTAWCEEDCASYMGEPFAWCAD